MPKVAFSESYTSIWRGVDCLKLIDGLSCNKVIGLEKGHVIQTAIMNNRAKIIDFVTVINFGEFLALVGFMPNYEEMINFVTPKILQSDVSISDVSHLNDVMIIYDEELTIETGRFLAEDNITYAKIYPDLTIAISAKSNSLEIDSTEKAFHEWRINRVIPWYNYEIRKNVTPYASGLNEFVHESKGCFAGQEILTRMRTRNKGIKNLIKIENNSIEDKKITTRGSENSLAIF
tara:strand:+ start:1471 stop:2169 length:699 start_codon:yes stop_codon:yes gene_type:complete